MLFEEKLELFAALRKERPVTWVARTRGRCSTSRVYPPDAKPAADDLGRRRRQPANRWSAPRSYGLPLMLAIIGGEPIAFAPVRRALPRALTELEFPTLPVGVHSPGHVAATDEQAMNELWPHYSVMMTSIGRERAGRR